MTWATQYSITIQFGYKLHLLQRISNVIAVLHWRLSPTYLRDHQRIIYDGDRFRPSEVYLTNLFKLENNLVLPII